MSPITQNQWRKVFKALVYSFSSSFVGALLLGLTSTLQEGKAFDKKLLTSLVIAAVITALNTLAVMVKQLFTADTTAV